MPHCGGLLLPLPYTLHSAIFFASVFLVSLKFVSAPRQAVYMLDWGPLGIHSKPSTPLDPAATFLLLPLKAITLAYCGGRRGLWHSPVCAWAEKGTNRRGQPPATILQNESWWTFPYLSLYDSSLKYSFWTNGFVKSVQRRTCSCDIF